MNLGPKARKMKLDGYTLKEIAEELNLNVPQVAYLCYKQTYRDPGNKLKLEDILPHWRDGLNCQQIGIKLGVSRYRVWNILNKNNLV